MNALLLVLRCLTIGIVADASPSDTVTFDKAETGKAPAFRAPHVTVTLDGRKALDWQDKTFKDAGKVGVWTKADSVTLFDDFSYAGK